MLYNVKTGERVNVPADQWQGLLLSGKYNFDKNSSVPFTDPSGNIVEISGKDAASTILNPYDSSLRPATDEDIIRYNNQKIFGGTGQKILTDLEKSSSSVSLGLSDIAARKVIEISAGTEAGKQYQEAKKLREEINPISSSLGEVVGACFLVYGFTVFYKKQYKSKPSLMVYLNFIGFLLLIIALLNSPVSYMSYIVAGIVVYLFNNKKGKYYKLGKDKDEQLKKLEKLHENKEISDEEYHEIKRQLTLN